MTAQTESLSSTRLIPREVLFGNPVKAQPKLSPDGKYFSYLAPNENNVLNVWVRTLGQNDDRMVTKDNDRGVSWYFWQLDNQHIFYPEDHDGDENWHIMQTDILSAETRNLTPFSGSQAYVVAVEPAFPEEMLIASNKRDAHLFDVYRINLINGTLTEVARNPGNVQGWQADHQLRIRVAQVQRSDGSLELLKRDDNDTKWIPFMTWGSEESRGGISGFTPDSEGIYVTTSVGANAARLVEVNLKTGEQKIIAEDKQFDLSETFRHPLTHSIEAVKFTKEKDEWIILDESVRADFEKIASISPGNFHFMSRTDDHKKWIVGYVIDTGSVRYYAYERANKEAEFLFSIQPELDEYNLAPMQPISFLARDGMQLYGYLTLPLKGSAKAEPPHMVMLVHGGPWGRDCWGFHSEVQWLANRGYSVLQINFRGSTGYGKDYLNAGNREWGRKMHDDLIDGKRWAVENGYASSERVAIFGTSYGGYAALVGVAFTPDEFCCGVDVVGPSNLVSLLESVPPYWETEMGLFNKRVGNVETEKEFLESCSPLFKAHQITVPLLIAQGANDPRVKQAESDQIVDMMRKNGQVVEYILFEDEGHGFAKPENRLKFFEKAEAFLEKHLKKS